MNEFLSEAEGLDSAIDAGHADDAGLAGLVELAGGLRRSLGVRHLDAAGRTRIYANAIRLAEGSPIDAQVRRVMTGIHVGRRTATVLGGVAAGAVAAAIGYAVVHGRHHQRRPGAVTAG